MNSIVVARWKPYVFKKLGQVYINILIKAGIVNEVEAKWSSCKINAKYRLLLGLDV